MSALYTFLNQRFESINQKLWLSILVASICNGGGILAYALWGKSLLANLSAANLFFMASLMFVNQDRINRKFIIIAGSLILLGLSAEWIGVHTALLFGHYAYTKVLGISVANVPVIIGINWAVVLFGCFALARLMLSSSWLPQYLNTGIVQVILTALLATLFDYLLEPVAIHLNFWQWKNAEIPFFNYVSWFAISSIGAVILKESNVPENRFAAALMIIQAAFFVGLSLLTFNYLI